MPGFRTVFERLRPVDLQNFLHLYMIDSSKALAATLCGRRRLTPPHLVRVVTHLGFSAILSKKPLKRLSVSWTPISAAPRRSLTPMSRL